VSPGDRWSRPRLRTGRERRLRHVRTLAHPSPRPVAVCDGLLALLDASGNRLDYAAPYPMAPAGQLTR
jgi:hypothetical protein